MPGLKTIQWESDKYYESDDRIKKTIEQAVLNYANAHCPAASVAIICSGMQKIWGGSRGVAVQYTDKLGFMVGNANVPVSL
jgi:ABC-type transport system involved in Fe-S cluster assembly fused permease/ATPase subunit